MSSIKDRIVNFIIPTEEEEYEYENDNKKQLIEKEQIFVIKINKFEETHVAASKILNGTAVVCSVTEKDEQRIMDFLCGVVFALNGKVKIIAPQTYLCTPGGVGVGGNIIFDKATK